MTPEQQCLAMEIDQGWELLGTRFYNHKTKTFAKPDDYTTREAVVEAIKRKGKSDEEFQYKFSDFLGEIFNKKNGYRRFIYATASVEALREAYLKASGLWVEEDEKEELKSVSATSFVIDEKLKEEVAKIASQSAKDFLKAMKKSGELKVVNFVESKEEVFLPTYEQIDLKINGNEILTYLERFIYWFEPVENSSKASSWRKLLTSLIAEVRRGK